MSAISQQTAELQYRNYNLLRSYFNIDPYTYENLVLYDVHSYCSVPSKVAMELDFLESQRIIVDSINSFLKCYVDIGTLRTWYASGFIDLDRGDSDYYDSLKLSPGNTSGTPATARSGPDSFRIYLNWESVRGKKRTSEFRLVHLQFLAFVSYIIKLLFQKRTRTGVSFSASEQSLIDTGISIAVNTVVNYWTQVRWGSWAANWHENMRIRTQRVLGIGDGIGYTFPVDYYAAIVDADWFMFILAADLCYLLNNYSSDINETNFPELTPGNVILITECRDYDYLVSQECVVTSPGFTYQPGIFHNYHSHRFYNYTGTTYPADTEELTYINEEATWDFSHASRLVVMFYSLKDSYINDPHSDRIPYYYSLISALAGQIVNNCSYVNGVPLFSNYIDGANGWYRVNYNNRGTGYSPYTQSREIVSNFLFLSGINEDFNTIVGDLYLMMSLTAPSSVAIRTAYYGTDSTGRNDMITTVDNYGTDAKNKASIFYANYWGLKALGVL